MPEKSKIGVAIVNLLLAYVHDKVPAFRPILLQRVLYGQIFIHVKLTASQYSLQSWAVALKNI
jgi:hypothetical protein